MRQNDLIPPVLPDELSHLDTARSPLERAITTHYTSDNA